METQTRFLLMALFLLATTLVRAQEEEKKTHVDLKFFTGFNSAGVSNELDHQMLNGEDYLREIKGKTSYQFGAALAFGGKFYFEVGAQWLNSNFRELNTNTQNVSDTYRDNVRLSQLYIPAKIGFRIYGLESEKPVNIRIFAGAAGAFPLSAKHKQSGGIPEYDKKDFTAGRFSLTFGAGLDWSLFFVELGYDVGLSHLFKDDNDKAKLGMFAMNVGVRF